MASNSPTLTLASSRKSFQSCGYYYDDVDGGVQDWRRTQRGHDDTFDKPSIYQYNDSRMNTTSGSTQTSFNENLQTFRVDGRPKRPQYENEQARLDSFDGWPTNHPKEPTILVKAGFFFTGQKDCARCYYCGIGLCSWLEDDDVWVEHARGFPRCAFLRHHKGNLFVEVVLDLEKRMDTISYQDVLIEIEAQK